MNTEDRLFLESLGMVPMASTGSAAGFGVWRILVRGGRVLLLLPDKGPDFRLGLSLYLPLRKIASLVVWGLRKIPEVRRFLPSVRLQFPDAGVVGKIVEERKVTPVSILLGNPSQAERRALLLCRQGDGSMQVAKVGVSPKARQKIVREASVLKSLSKALPESGVFPPLLGTWQEEDWDGFLLPFYDQGGAVDWSLGEVVGILKAWVVGKKANGFQECPSWLKIRDRLTEREREEARSILLCPALRHGDFAPWNILDAGHRKPVVIDWEFGRLNDVPGWDLVHYLLMTSYLIEGKQIEETIERVANEMEGEAEVRAYLKSVGWAGHEGLLFKSYLLMMGEQLSGFLGAMEGRIIPGEQSIS